MVFPTSLMFLEWLLLILIKITKTLLQVIHTYSEDKMGISLSGLTTYRHKNSYLSHLKVPLHP